MVSKAGKRSLALKQANATPKNVADSWVLMISESLFEKDTFSIITLPHPSNGRPSKYCLSPSDKNIYEVVTFCDPNRSWFIGDTVKSDGRLLMCTPINPVFLILPRLKSQCSNKAVPLRDLLSEKGYDKLYDYIDHLNEIADLKGPEDLKAYKYNQEKTLNWLKKRVEIVAKVVREKNIHVSSSAVSATFVPSTLSNGDVDEELYNKYAFGLVSEYLEDDLVTRLEENFKFKPEFIEHIGKKRKSETENNHTTKKIKLEDKDCIINNISVNPVELKKPKVLTAKEKARQKAASGTKTISAFFSRNS